MSKRTIKLAVPAVVASLALVACGGAGGEGEGFDNTGSATAAITNVPSDVGCIEITVSGARIVDRKFDVATGASSILTLSGLPVGSATFVGQAFSGACSAVGPSSVATWVSDPVAASLVSSVNVAVALSLHRNGTSTVSVDFVDDGSDAGALTCSAPLTMCGGACVNVSTSATNCGACNAVCPAGALCTSGMCACPSGMVMCGGACADVSSSATNCGTCGHACGTGRACVSGLCL